MNKESQTELDMRSDTSLLQSNPFQTNWIWHTLFIIDAT